MGAACNSTGSGNDTDDTSAINAALSAARASAKSSLWQPIRIEFLLNRRCLVKGSLNFTGFVLPGMSVEGGVIDCQTAGAVCIDALGSRFIKWDVEISGLQTNAPSIRIQIGRNSSNSADFFDFSHVRMNGFFTFTGL